MPISVSLDNVEWLCSRHGCLVIGRCWVLLLTAWHTKAVWEIIPDLLSGLPGWKISLLALRKQSVRDMFDFYCGEGRYEIVSGF